MPSVAVPVNCRLTVTGTLDSGKGRRDGRRTAVFRKRIRRDGESDGRSGLAWNAAPSRGPEVGDRRTDTGHQVIARTVRQTVVPAGDIVEIGAREVVEPRQCLARTVQRRQPALARNWSASATNPAHMGVAKLVPPTCRKVEVLPVKNESTTNTPVLGSASIETSGLVRMRACWSPFTLPIW